MMPISTYPNWWSRYGSIASATWRRALSWLDSASHGGHTLLTHLGVYGSCGVVIQVHASIFLGVFESNTHPAPSYGHRATATPYIRASCIVDTERDMLRTTQRHALLKHRPASNNRRRKKKPRVYTKSVDLPTGCACLLESRHKYDCDLYFAWICRLCSAQCTQHLQSTYLVVQGWA
jgi:hypothetical protein